MRSKAIFPALPAAAHREHQEAVKKFQELCAGFYRRWHLTYTLTTSRPLEEQELIRLLQQGDAAAFRMLLAAYGDRVYNTSLSLLQQAEAAEDVAQEVFVAVYKNIGTFRGDARLSTWIYRIAVTKSLEALRKRKRQHTLPDEVLANLPAPSFHHPGVLSESRERAAVLFAAVDRLPGQQKPAFVLHHVEGLSYAEVALVLETTLPAVESLIYRAKQNLRKMLASFYKGHG